MKGRKSQMVEFLSKDRLGFIVTKFLGLIKKMLVYIGNFPYICIIKTNKDMKSFTISITKEQILKMNKAASRNAEIESGLRMPTTRVYKSEKAYNRKPKYKTEWV